MEEKRRRAGRRMNVGGRGKQMHHLLQRRMSMYTRRHSYVAMQLSIIQMGGEGLRRAPPPFRPLHGLNCPPFFAACPRPPLSRHSYTHTHYISTSPPRTVWPAH